MYRVFYINKNIKKKSLQRERQRGGTDQEFGINNITTAAAAAAAAKSLQSCLTLRDPLDGSPPGSPHSWDSPGKNTRVGCHFLLPCMKVKSESEVAQLCPTLRDPMDCSLPGSSVHGIFQARVLEWGATAFSSITTTIYKLSFPGGSDGKASVYNVGDPGSIPGSGRSPGKGNGNHR